MSEAEKRIDDFQLVSTIASGHSSQVWEVRDGGGGIHAMKLLRPDSLKDADQVSTLKHEAKVGQALSHPNIIRVHRFVKTKGHCYMLMEYFNCPNLKSQLKSEPESVRARLPQLVENLCTALAFMHEKGWLHHDLKPDNILVDNAGALKLIDFSLAMRKKGSLGKMVGGKVKVVQGTRTYIAPETIKKQYPTAQSDMYSLGITLFEILTGQPPFVASSPNDLLMKHINSVPWEPSSYNSNVTPEADKVILRLLAKKPEKRPQDMAEIAAEFRSLKIFKTDPAELARKEKERKEQERLEQDASSRLDSRADAQRTAAGMPAPMRPAARKPTARAVEMARKAGLDVSKHVEGEEAPAPEQQPEHQHQYGWHPDWAGYAAQGYPQQYWPQYPPQGGQSQQGYYPYPPEGQYAYPQHYDPNAAPPSQSSPQQQHPPQPPPPQQQPPQAQPEGAGQPAEVDRDESPPKRKRASAGSAQQPEKQKQPAKTSDEHIPPGQGRGRERHPTQEDVDPDSIPTMEELPDVL